MLKYTALGILYTARIVDPSTHSGITKSCVLLQMKYVCATLTIIRQTDEITRIGDIVTI